MNGYGILKFKVWELILQFFWFDWFILIWGKLEEDYFFNDMKKRICQYNGRDYILVYRVYVKCKKENNIK